MGRISKAVREQVRERAGQRCEYCRKPEAYSVQSHQVDHIISQKHNGTDRSDNLAWACFQCNNCKGSDVGGFDSRTGEFVPFFHPRRENWDEHFRLRGPEIVGSTPTGRVTVAILQMNDADQIETRQILMANDLW